MRYERSKTPEETAILLLWHRPGGAAADQLSVGAPVARHAVQEVDYGTFMTMTENKEIGKVEVEDNQIIFTNKDGSKIYKTGPMNDPDLTQRLYDAGAEFTRDIVEQTSPLLSVVLTWVLPIVLFIAVGQLMAKKLTDRAGGPGS